MLEKGPLLRTQHQAPDGPVGLQARRAVRDRRREAADASPGMANIGESYYSSHVEPDLNDEPHVYRDADGARLRDDRGLHRPGRRRRHAALRRRLAALHARRLAAADLQRRPHRPARRPGRRRRARGARLAGLLRRARAVLRRGRASWSASTARAQNQDKPASVDHYQPPLEPNPISRVRRAPGWTRSGWPLPHAAGGHHRGPRAERPHGAGRPTSDQDRLRQPLRRSARAEVEHVGRRCSRRSSASRTSSCGRTASSRTSKPSGSRVTTRPLPRPGGQPAHGRRRRSSSSPARRSRACGCCSSRAQPTAGASASASTRTACSAATSSPTASAARQRCCPSALRQVQDAGLRLGDRLLRATSFIRANGLWAGGAIYNNTSDAALPISLGAHLAGAGHGQHLEGLPRPDTTWSATASRTTSTTTSAAALSVSFMANQVAQRDNRIELHPTVRDKWGRAVAYIIKDWHAHDRTLMDTLARPVRARSCATAATAARDYRRRGLGRRQRRSRGSPTTSSAARASAPIRPTRCSTRTAAPGSSTTSTSPTAPSCRPRAAPTRR